MELVKQIGDEHSFAKHKDRSEDSKSNEVLPKGITTYICLLGTALKGNDTGITSAELGGESLLNVLLLSQWEDYAWKGELRYDVTTCEIKIIRGGFKFIAQMNEKWNPSFLAKFEKKIFPPFSPLTESCVKSCRKDILFCISYGDKEVSELVPSSVLPKEGILIMANANPIEYGHSFLVPYNAHQMPHLFNKKSIRLVTWLAAEVNNCAFRIFYDHDATKIPNPEYFQASYFASPLPVELLPTTPVYGDLCRSEMYIGEVADYPLKALVIISKKLEDLTKIVGEICSILHNNQTVFSLLICDLGTKMFLFPQARTQLLDHNLSSWECGGYFVCETKYDFNHVSEEKISKLLTSVSLDDNSFQSLKELCLNAADKLVGRS